MEKMERKMIPDTERKTEFHKSLIGQDELINFAIYDCKSHVIMICFFI